MRTALLALLTTGPAHGYDLKRRLEEGFGEALPPVNAGQIYTTLGRLERDGLVEGDRVAQDGRPNKRVYRLTAAGREEVVRWVGAPTPGTRLKDEFFTKLVVARNTGIADPRALIERQRSEYLQALRDVEEHARRGNGNVAATLLFEGAALHLEADLKWLALCEQRMTLEEPDGSLARSPRSAIQEERDDGQRSES
jgi:DNA-binding PadR family transcriptional regulator